MVEIGDQLHSYTFGGPGQALYETDKKHSQELRAFFNLTVNPEWMARVSPSRLVEVVAKKSNRWSTTSNTTKTMSETRNDAK